MMGLEHKNEATEQQSDASSASGHHELMGRSGCCNLGEAVVVKLEMIFCVYSFSLVYLFFF